MKVIGALMIVSVSSLFGYDIAKRFKNRSNEIQMLIYALQIMESEMGYSMQPLQNVFKEVSRKTNGPVSVFYNELSKELNHIVFEFDDIWQKSVERFMDYSAIKNEEKEILNQFGRNLGHHTFEQQSKYISLTTQYLEHQLMIANGERKKYEKTMKLMGVLIGVFVVILLF